MNLVITISRRFGTGASLIAQELSEKLGVPVYDKAYIEHELDGDSYATEAEVIKGLAEHPCIILGRCASEILKDQPNVFNVYVCADKDDLFERILKNSSLSSRIMGSFNAWLPSLGSTLQQSGGLVILSFCTLS